MNEVLLIIEVIVVFSLLLIAKKCFGKSGIFAWIAFATVFANIQVTKTVNILGLSSTLGSVLFSSVFLATDILNECYSVKDSKKGVYIGLFAVISYIIVSQITLAFVPNSTDIMNSAMKQIFTLAPRVCLSSVVMFFFSNIADVYLYEKLKQVFNNKKMWLRNNISTIVCNCLENFMFVFGAFLFVYPFSEVVMIAITTCIIEIIVALLDTPFLYLAKKIKDIE